MATDVHERILAKVERNDGFRYTFLELVCNVDQEGVKYQIEKLRVPNAKNAPWYSKKIPLRHPKSNPEPSEKAYARLKKPSYFHYLPNVS